MSRPSEAARRFLSCRTPGALRRLRDAGDDGFTLIELVVVLVILPLIMGALAVALLVTFQEQVGVSTRISTSADAQVTSAYFVRDVESAMYVTTATTPAPGSATWPSAAGPVGACGSGTALIVSLAWPTGQQPIDKTATVVSYWRMPKGLLERELCRGSASPSSSITSRDFLSPFAHALVSCATSAPCATAAATRWVSATAVSGLTLAVTEHLTKGSYDYSLTAAPRASSTQGAYAAGGTKPASPPPVPPILALGSGPRVIKESGGKTTPTPTLATPTSTSTKGMPASIKVVTGQAVLNTGYFDMAKKTQFLAPYIWVTPGSTPCSGSGQCGSKSGKGKGSDTVKLCATTKPPKPTCYTPTPEKPKPWTTHSAVKDPFSALTDPTADLLGYTPRPCKVPSTGNLAPGEYDCGGAPFTLTGNGTTAKLADGIYIFDTGLKVNGNAALTGTTVLVYLPCKASDPWVPAGTLATSCSEGFQVSNGQVTVTPLRTNRYSNLWFWQNKGDATTASVHGTGAIAVSTGILYAPAAKVKLSGLGSGTTNVGAIVATTFDVANSHVKVRGVGFLP